jgi:hypothetical protein
VDEKIIALGLAIVVFFWGIIGLSNLGFSLLNTVFWVYLFYKYPKLREDNVGLTWAILSLGLGWMVALRDFELVKFLSIVATFGLNTLTSARVKDLKSEINPVKIVTTVTETIARALAELISTITNVKLNVNSKKVPLGKIGIGVMMGIPLVLLFGGLLFSADPVFAQIIKSINLPKININPETVGRLILAGWFFGQALAMVGAKFGGNIKTNFELKQITEVNIAVGMVEVLFLIYTFVQIRYFGINGDELQAMSITYSEYTRRGYAELIVTSLLAWAMVLGLDMTLLWQKKLKINQTKITKVLGTMILGHVVLFVASATRRNLLYLGAYGFTRVRLLGMALSIWIIVVAVLTLIKLLKNRSQDFFSKGLITITAFAILGLNIANIDRTIIKYRRASLPTGVDYRYLSDLSNDAWEGWKEVLEGQLGRVAEEIKAGRWSDEKVRDLGLVIGALSSKQDQLNRQSEKYWQYGGGLNLAGWQSKKMLESIPELKRIREELTNSQKDPTTIFIDEAKRQNKD